MLTYQKDFLFLLLSEIRDLLYHPGWSALAQFLAYENLELLGWAQAIILP